MKQERNCDWILGSRRGADQTCPKCESSSVPKPCSIRIPDDPQYGDPFSGESLFPWRGTRLSLCSLTWTTLVADRAYSGTIRLLVSGWRAGLFLLPSLLP